MTHKHSPLPPVLLIAGSLAIAGGVGVGNYVLTPPQLDEHLCQAGVAAPHLLMLYLDVTDLPREIDARKVRAELERRIAGLKANDRVVAVVLDPQPAGAVSYKALDICRPDDGSNAKGWVDNKAMLTEAFRTRFEQPVRKFVAEFALAKSGSTSPSSPLVEGLARFVDDPNAKAKSRELVIVSDLIEHSDLANFYRGAPQFAAIEKKGLGSVRRLKEALADTDVTVLLVREQEAQRYQTPELKAFWVDLFAHAGVSGDRLVIHRP